MPVSPRSNGRLWFGLIVLTVGVLFTLDNLGLLDASEYIKWWPLLIIAGGIARIVRSPNSSGLIGGLIVVFIGVLLLDNMTNIIPGRMWSYWPVLLILFGASIVVRAWQGPGSGSPGTVDAADRFTAFSFMSGVERKITSLNFHGGDATAIMGGCEIDLRQARIGDGPAVIDVFAFWGGIELFVPSEWVVRNEAVPIMGGLVDSRKSVSAEGGSVVAGIQIGSVVRGDATTGTDPNRVLIIRGGALMGGIEIKN